MRREIDYRFYDPAEFDVDHPGDAVVSSARDRGAELADQFRDALLEGTPIEQRRYVEQSFDTLQSNHWDDTDLVNKQEQYKALLDHKAQLRQETQRDGREAVDQAHGQDGQVAAWEGVPEELQRIEKMTMPEARSKDPAFDDKVEQLTHYQAARNEAASNEIEKAREQVLRERGLDKVEESERVVEAAQPDDSTNDRHIPSDVMERSAEDKARDAELAKIRETLSRSTVRREGEGRDHTPDD